MKNFLYVFFCSCCLVFANCSLVSQPTELSGDVFIATRGGQSFKLGAVPIYVVKINQLEGFLSGRKAADLKKENGVAWYYSNLPKGIDVLAQTTTNSDGKYQLQVPRGEYAVIASATRAVGIDKDEDYYWIIKQTFNSEKQTLNLDNNNLLTYSDIIAFSVR